MLNQVDILHSLERIPCFLDLHPEGLTKLSKISEYRSKHTGEYLFKEGDREDYLYILLEGQVSISSHVPNHGEIYIFTAEPFDMIGWSSLTPIVRQRTASAQLRSDCVFIALEGEALRKLCDQDHEIGYIFMRRISNIIASRFLSTRVQLYDLILKS